MPALRELPQQMPPREKLGYKSPRANFWCNPQGCMGIAMDEISEETSGGGGGR